MEKLFDQFHDQLVEVTFVRQGVQGMVVGILRRNLDGFWHLVCDLDLTAGPTVDCAVRCDDILLVKRIDKEMLVRLAQEKRDAAKSRGAIQVVGGAPIA